MLCDRQKGPLAWPLPPVTGHYLVDLVDLTFAFASVEERHLKSLASSYSIALERERICDIEYLEVLIGGWGLTAELGELFITCILVIFEEHIVLSEVVDVESDHLCCFSVRVNCIETFAILDACD